LTNSFIFDRPVKLVHVISIKKLTGFRIRAIDRRGIHTSLVVGSFIEGQIQNASIPASINIISTGNKQENDEYLTYIWCRLEDNGRRLDTGGSGRQSSRFCQYSQMFPDREQDRLTNPNHPHGRLHKQRRSKPQQSRLK
jgi:hypothetical protein